MCHPRSLLCRCLGKRPSHKSPTISRRDPSAKRCHNPFPEVAASRPSGRAFAETSMRPTRTTMPLHSTLRRESGGRPRRPPKPCQRLLQLDLGAGGFELRLDSSASSLVTPSLTALGAPSTRSLASLRPRPVIARTSLMTLILLAPAFGQDDVELGLLLGRSGSGGATGQRRPPRPERRRKRPTSLRAASTARPPRGR